MQVNSDDSDDTVLLLPQERADQGRFRVAKFRKPRRFMKFNWVVATFTMATFVGWMTLG